MLQDFDTVASVKINPQNVFTMFYKKEIGKTYFSSLKGFEAILDKSRKRFASSRYRS